MTDSAPVRPLRIGVCAPYDLALDGGVNSHIRSQARALRALGHAVVVFGASSKPGKPAKPAASARSRSKEIQGLPIEPDERIVGRCVSLVLGGTETPISLDPLAWRRVGALLESSGFDVLHVHEPLMPLVPWFAVIQSRAPVVATFHVHREQGHRWYARYGWTLTPLMRRVRVRLAVSEAARRTVARAFPGEYHVIPNGIDVTRFMQPLARPETMPADRLHVVYVGRLEPRKGVGRLVEAMSIVAKDLPNVRLLIVGDGPDRAALEAAARQGGVDAQFEGRVPDAVLPAYYRAADVVCSPALGGESFGIVLLEAMAAERAVVATRIEGYEELVTGSGCVQLVPPDDPVALAREIARLLGDQALRDTLGSRGARFAREFDWSRVALRLQEVYGSVVGRTC
jgi:phosphatidylinositol alpha-mannosyltransferase